MAVAFVIDEVEVEKWISTLPETAQALARKIKPGTLYRLKSTGHRVFPISYAEDGTLTVCVSGDFNLVKFERNVFGITSEDLEECDLPGPEETVGVLMSPEETAEYIESLRVEVNSSKT